MKRLASLGLLALACSAIAAPPPVPKEYVGDWVPQHASCKSPLRVRVGTDAVTLVNGSRSQKFGGLDVCYRCEGGAGRDVGAVWLMPEFDTGQSPLTLRLYANEKTGVVEFEGAPLKKRFPLHEVKLRKCPSRT